MSTNPNILRYSQNLRCYVEHVHLCQPAKITIVNNALYVDLVVLTPVNTPVNTLESCIQNNHGQIWSLDHRISPVSGCRYNIWPACGPTSQTWNPMTENVVDCRETLLACACLMDRVGLGAQGRLCLGKVREGCVISSDCSPQLHLIFCTSLDCRRLSRTWRSFLSPREHRRHNLPLLNLATTSLRLQSQCLSFKPSRNVRTAVTFERDRRNQVESK